MCFSCILRGSHWTNWHECIVLSPTRWQELAILLLSILSVKRVLWGHLPMHGWLVLGAGTVCSLQRKVRPSLLLPLCKTPFILCINTITPYSKVLFLHSVCWASPISTKRQDYLMDSYTSYNSFSYKSELCRPHKQISLFIRSDFFWKSSCCWNISLGNNKNTFTKISIVQI